jgi:hypothetical protein
MIPVSINLHHDKFSFLILGEGLLELLLLDSHPGFVETTMLYLGAGTRKLLLPYQHNPKPIDHEIPTDWIDALISYESAASLIEWCRNQKARGNWEPAPNKSSKIVQAYGKRIILPHEIQTEYEARHHAAQSGQ